ncbi:semaphorin-6D isoform X4 [Tachyglossus aculeatus]|uniref:semaphorin-6D isoform X4 n=1 Tax=Tachyglossus aculeatus TaxID=9261 RepID=UPI0018F41BA4|nr:semaphorin-6D isoform X4 [Tachyglossus aculeatus]
MRLLLLQAWTTLLAVSRLWAASFPEDEEPINAVDSVYTQQYPVFRGRPSGNESQHRLDFQLMVKIRDTLFIAGRDQVYTVNLNEEPKADIIPHKKLVWRSRQQDRENCAMKGKHRDECHNFIKVFVPRNDEMVFVCGTNAFNPMCRYYRLNTLEYDGEEISGLARCPFDARQTNVALFADGKLYSATVADFLASDAVIYRSLGDGSALRTIKYDSKWIKEPHFLHATEYGNFVYFFFREIAVEHNSLGKAVYSRVARICKNDVGGSQRVLEKHWTSFLKARLNCSVPGDSFFYFDVLQAVTDILSVGGVPTVLGVFTTQLNSIPGSAVCAFSMDDIEKVFEGRFKEQKSPDSVWTAVPEERVPSPRPGCCARHGLAEAYRTSIDFPDETLSFIKSHPLMDLAVPSLAEEPWFTKTRVRYRLTAIAVDAAAGPYRNHTVMFVGSEAGVLLKVLAETRMPSLNGSVLLEEIDAYHQAKCSRESDEDRKIIALQLDPEHHAVFVAYSGCVVRVPLSRCERFGSCKKSCISSRDPYCGWLSTGVCGRAAAGTLAGGFEQDTESGHTAHLGECHGVRWDVQASESSQMVHMNVLITCVFAAFVLGAFIAGAAVYCYRDALARRARKIRKDAESAQSCTDSGGSFAKLSGLFDSPVQEFQHHAGSPKLYATLLSGRKEAAPPGAAGAAPRAPPPPPELAALPTPESTPVLQPKPPSQAGRGPAAGRKDAPPFLPASPPPHSPLAPAPIPSAIVLPNATHDFNTSFSNSNAYRAERAALQAADHPLAPPAARRDPRRASDSRHAFREPRKPQPPQREGAAGPGPHPPALLGDLGAPSASLVLEAMGGLAELPPKVPHREASLYSPPSTLPRNSPTKRLDVPTAPGAALTSLERQRGYPRTSAQRHSISALPKSLPSPGGGGGTGTAAGLLFRQPCGPRGGGGGGGGCGGGYLSPGAGPKTDYGPGPPASGRLPPALSRQSGYAGPGTLPRSGLKRTSSLKPDVPPKPAFAPQTPAAVRPLNKYSY